jgi:hypothetical protein
MADQGSEQTQRHVVELHVLGEEMKAKVLSCIEKRGKITITTDLKGRFNPTAGFEQQVD